MALSVGEIEAVLRARDEMTPVIQAAAATAKASLGGVATATEEMSAQTHTSLAGEFATGFLAAQLSIEAVTGSFHLLGEAIETGAHLQDLHDRTGIAVGDLQAFDLAARQSGSSLDTVAKATEQLQRRLEEGTAPAHKALQDLGLDAKDLLAMDPGSMMMAIGDALVRIPDPAQKTAIAFELWGRQGPEMAVVAQHVSEIAGNMDTMSASQVAALHTASDEWEAWKDRVEINIGEFLGAVTSIQGLEDYFLPWKRTLDDAADSMDQAAAKAKALAPSLTQGLVPAAEGGGRSLASLGAEADKLTKHLKDGFAAQDAYNKKLQEQVDIITGKSLAKEVQLYADAIDRAGGVTKITDYQTDQLTTKFMHLGVEGANLKPELEAVIQKHIDLHGRMQPVIVDIQTLIGMFKNYELAINNIPPAIGSMVDNSQEKLGELLRIGGVDVDALKAKWEEYREEVGEKVPEAHTKMVATISGVLQQLFEGMLHGWDGFKAALKTIFDEIVKYYEEKFIAVLAEKLAEFLVGLGVGGAGGGFLGDLLGFLGSLVGGGNGNAPLPGEPLPGPPPSQNPGDPQPLPPGMAPPGVGVNPGSPVPKPLARGGYVDQPTLALVGEGGPEFVIPAEKMGDMFGGDTHVHVYIDGREAAEAIAPHLPRVAKRYGLTRPA